MTAEEYLVERVKQLEAFKVATMADNARLAEELSRTAEDLQTIKGFFKDEETAAYAYVSKLDSSAYEKVKRICGFEES